MLSGRRRRAPRSICAAVTLAWSVWLGSATAHAQSTSDDLARRHFDSGVAYLEERDYDNALKAFQKAYDLSKRPEILLNVATVHERQSDLPSAVAALQGYLEAAPQGEHVETVKLRIQNLEKLIQEQNRPVPRAEPNRMPAFICLGVGGVLAGASLATGVVAKRKYDDAKQTCGHDVGALRTDERQRHPAVPRQHVHRDRRRLRDRQAFERRPQRCGSRRAFRRGRPGRHLHRGRAPADPAKLDDPTTVEGKLSLTFGRVDLSTPEKAESTTIGGDENGFVQIAHHDTAEALGFAGPDWPAVGILPTHQVAVSWIQPSAAGDGTELHVQRY